jgi:hypothetical protein
VQGQSWYYLVHLCSSHLHDECKFSGTVTRREISCEGRKGSRVPPDRSLLTRIQTNGSLGTQLPSARWFVFRGVWVHGYQALVL